ncbi:methionyl-tRNA formyltransferase [Alcaligenes faecalis]|jgi:methionyl-tRNA formyltransferase|uniref:methionyl-tRNA formyltransferase n=1 Tax=Alcaligenes TaxID=507 RepID=UPI000E19C626|nr:methionyl-tRNA formyltransferase [Alcaligenes faecalis]ULH07118.1 methionyl-tRNA formyltransferase [Alcaligenes faecalis]SSY86048.1 Methionyl-tRNA formyltransferase [Alcaligenes faecalis subsp. faecalis]
MRIVFAGTPDFARIALEALLAQGFDVPLVMTQPDRPAGRGMKLSPSPVKQAAVNANIPVLQPHSLRLDGKYPEEAAQARHTLLDLQPDLMVVAAYGLILPKWTLELPRYGCFNIHASLLPRWRGAAPIQRAIQAGDAATGITIMQMDEGLDTGDMLVRSELAIRDDHSAATLHDDLAQLGAQALLEALQQVRDGTLQATPQPEEGVTYAEKLSKAESVLDLGQPAKELERRIRAFDPVPGSTLSLPGLEQPVKVWRAQALEQKHSAEPGEVLNVSAQGIDVACGEGVLRLLELQKAGSKRQPVAVFVQGWQSR